MNNQASAFSMTETRAALRVLKFLLKAPAHTESGTQSDKLLLMNIGGTIACENKLLHKLYSFGNIELKAGKVTITDTGKQHLLTLKKMFATDAGDDRDLDRQVINIGGHMHTVTVNSAESPLALLYRLNKQTGRRFLSDEEFQAGERLRADFTRGNMLPNITANWEAVAVKRSRGEQGGVADLSNHALDCRARVEKALKAVGPELSGVLLDICCFLKGLELVERERVWPARSAKMLLKTALSILHRHYIAGKRPETDFTGADFHWGDTDYRPSL